jgi:ATP-dependent RNA helicase DHR2
MTCNYQRYHTHKNSLSPEAFFHFPKSTLKASARLLATAATTTNNGLRPALALLPPIPLYRRLFRAHRNHLPTEMRLLGDEYIKAEFRAHRDVDNPAHMVSQLSYLLSDGRRTEPIEATNLSSKIGFLTEWQLYAQKIEGDSWKGERIDQGKIEKLSGLFPPNRPLFGLAWLVLT